MVSSASNTRISASDSAMIPPKAARVSSALASAREISSARLRNLVSGVLRSCAILSDTSRKPVISSPMRASIALRFSARRSSSSPAPVSSSR